MKYLFINSVIGIRSTGRICTDLALSLEKEGHEVKIAYGREFCPEKFKRFAIPIGSKIAPYFNALRARLSDNEGLNAKIPTMLFLKEATKFDPDVLWLHNLHGYYINYPLLFNWIKSRPQMKVRWTLHDCWAFTGHCTHFSYVKCDRWTSGCGRCPQKSRYPTAWLHDRSAKNHERKKRAFCGVPDMQIITPSFWLADLVKLSFLREYPVTTVHNTIDLAAFRPVESDFRSRYHLEDKKIILGVASEWNDRKGYRDYWKLADLLPANYQVVLVGVAPRQIKKLPENILGIPRTNSAKDLAAIYTAADYFVNLTYEDTYPTVNLEAQACGTPAFTYRTGGSVESVPYENVVEVGAITSMAEKILEHAR